MKTPIPFNRKGVLSVLQSIRNMPKLAWGLVVLAFALGLLIRGGGGDRTDETRNSHVHDEAKVEWWTCSMHPQIKLPEPGQCPICFMDLIPLETEDSGDVPTELKMSPAAMKLAEIATARVRRGPAKKTILLSGKVAVDETRLGRIAAWAPGRIEKLYVDYTGIFVKKGDPLVELYSPELYAAQEEFLQARQRNADAQSGMSKTTAKATLDASEEKLRQLGLTDEQIEEIEKRGTAKDRVTIHSPMSGVVVHKNAVEGLYVAQGTQIYAIADLSQAWVVLDVYETDLSWLRKGHTVSFTVEAIPEERFEGKVVFVDPILDERTRTVPVRLNVDNHKEYLKPGMFVRAEVTSQIRPGTDGRLPVLVPATAVLKTGKRAVVYVKKMDSEEPVFEGREIVVGARAGDDFIVISGLREGEEVVVKGNFKIDSAFQLAAKPSMMNPEGGMAMTGHEHHGDSEATPPNTSEKQKKIEAKGEAIDVSITFVQNLGPVYDAYFEAQAVLAGDNFEAVQKALAGLDEKILNVSTKELKESSKRRWDEIKASIHDVAQHAHHWSNIDAARKAFESISISILAVEKEFGHTGDRVHYEVFCPMAFDNKGASWLQNHEIVDNPYFGSAMQRCGEIKEAFEGKR